MRRALAFAAALAARAAAADQFPEPEQFATERLRVAGRLTSVHAEDLDGDGRRDLIALFVDGQPPAQRRRIALFFDHRGFRAAPDQVLDAPAGASFVTAADVAGDARRELLFADAQGLGYLALGEHGFGDARRLVAVAGLALLAEEDELPWLDVARDWDGDGKVEILLPAVDRVHVIARNADGGWSVKSELQLPPKASYLVRTDSFEPRARNYWMRAALVVPELFTGDFDGDGRADLVAVVDDEVSVFRGAPGGFSTAPAARVRLGARTADETARGNAQVQVSLLDLDGDGILDIVVNKVVGGLGAMRAQIGVYHGKKGGAFGKPTQVFTREGFAGALQFADLDGDRRPELIVCHAEVGFAEAARIVLSRRLSATFEVYRNRGRAGFSERPDAERPIDFAVDYSTGADLDGPFPTLADFDGDGAPDLVGPKEAGALAVWRGGGKALLADYPRAIVHLPLTRYYRALDLDGDRRADLILWYRFVAERQGQIVVLRNTGKGW